MPNVYKTEQLTEQSTTSATFIDVPGASVTFTPGSTGEVWVAFVSGVMRSSSTAEESIEVRLTINGTEEDLCGHQNNAATSPNGGGFVMFERITGTTASQTVKLQYRAVAGTSYVDDVRVVVAKIPAGADVQYDATDAITEVTGTVVTTCTLSWTPSSAGDYIVLGRLSHREYPGGTTSRSWFQDTGATPLYHPESPTLIGSNNARDCWNPTFCAWRTTLTATAKTMYGSFRSSNNGIEASQYRYAKLMAFRADVFDANYYSLSETQSTTTSTSFQTKNSLAVPAPPTAREFLTIRNARISADDTGTTARRTAEFRRAGAALLQTNLRINRNGSNEQGYHNMAGVVDARMESGAITYANGYLSPDSVTAQIAESSIICLRYPSGDNAPFFGMIA